MARSITFHMPVRIWVLLLLALCTNAYTALTDDSLKSIPGPGDDFNIKSGSILAPILVPRVAGTEGSTKVLNHLANFFKTNLPQWEISFQNSTSKTPVTGSRDIPFVNMIATRDPPWTSPGESSHLTLVAHYDSKLTPDGFIGATDSAAPCAMLMHAARSVDAAMTKKWDTMAAEGIESGGFEGVDEHKGLQILFLDGEEAFLSWTDTDSLYGARALAQEWESTSHPALSTYRNSLSSISLFLLLDLLGASGPTVPSYFKMTHWAYRKMAVLETRLRGLSRFKSSPNHPSKRAAWSKNNNKAKGIKRDEPAFLSEYNKGIDRWRGGMVLDDHVPFMDRGVEVLHIIPTPFPRVWHEIEDDGEHLDLDTVEDWSTLVIAFVGEWLDLEGFLEPEQRRHLPKSEFS